MRPRSVPRPNWWSSALVVFAGFRRGVNKVAPMCARVGVLRPPKVSSSRQEGGPAHLRRPIMAVVRDPSFFQNFRFYFNLFLKILWLSGADMSFKYRPPDLAVGDFGTFLAGWGHQLRVSHHLSSRNDDVHLRWKPN